MLRQADDVTQVSRDHDRARDALLPRLSSRDHCRDSIKHCPGWREANTRVHGAAVHAVEFSNFDIDVHHYSQYSE